MISVSGNYWEEARIDQRIVDKIKIDHDLEDLIARIVIFKNFNDEEIFSLSDNIELKNPFSKTKDFLDAVQVLDNSISNNEKICIIGDYDVDGCVSASLIVKLLKFINAKHFYYIPNRFTDGYGSTTSLFKKIISKKPDLVIMVDNGSNSIEAVNFLNKRKIKSIIIDHHEIYRPYPKSNALINPKKDCDYKEFNYFCTGVLTYFLIDIYLKKKKLKIKFSNNLDLVLLTIVADIMPLRRYNRIIAKEVLNNINFNQNYFFKKVFDIKKIKKPIEIDDFSFLFGPILNSAGRLNDPNIVVELLTTNEEVLKNKLINKLILLNEKRKLIEKNILMKIGLKNIKSDKNLLIIVEDNNINEGLIGIIASKIKTYFNKPTIVITKSGNIYKGSGRSTTNFPMGKYIKSALDNKLLVTGGGHNLAAGFTLKKTKINDFKKFLYNKINKHNHKIKNNYLSRISLSSVNKKLISSLTILKPFGEANQSPFFLVENVNIIKPKLIDKKIITCFIKNKSGKMISAISFNTLETDLVNNILYNQNEISLIIQLKENFWNNKKSVQAIIIDILITSNKA